MAATHDGSRTIAVSPSNGLSDGDFTIETVLRSLRRRLRLIAGVTLAGTAAAAYVGHNSTPLYTATASVVLDASAARLVDSTPAGTADAPDQRFVDTQVALARSQALGLQVMERLELDEPSSSEPEDEATYQTLDDLGRLMLARVAAWFPLSALPSVAAGVDPPERLDAEAEVEAEERTGPTPAEVEGFMSGLETFQVSNSLLIGISYTSPHPKTAARVANATADQFLAAQVERKRQSARNAAEWLEARLGEMRAAVREAEAEAADFRATNNLLGAVGDRFDDQRLANLQRQLLDIGGEEIALQAQLARARATRSHASGTETVDAAETLTSPLLVELRLRQTELIAQRTVLSQSFGPRHPQILNVDAQLAEQRAEIIREVDRIIQVMEDQGARLQSRRRAVEHDLADLRQGHRADGRLEAHLAELEREVETNRQLYADLLVRLRTVQKEEQTVTPDARIASRALVPDVPSNPGPMILGMIGFSSSLLLSGLLALFCERLDGRVRGADELERRLGSPALGVLPALPRRHARRIERHIANKPFTAYAEAARNILTALRLPPPGGPARVVLVTSALPGEGKTTMAISLATAAAGWGLRVLLIDLDLRRPAVGERLEGRARRAGLVDYLNGRLDRDALARRQPAGRFDFIPAGRSASEPLALLRGESMSALVTSLRSEYDLILLDSSPILAVADSRVSVALADLAILAARWSKVETEAVEHAVRSLRDMDAEVAGFVLTQVDLQRYRLYGRDSARYFRSYKKYFAN